MESTPRVLVVFGGRSSEHSISCISAGSILRAIDRSLYDVLAVGIARSGGWVLFDGDPADLVVRDGILPEVDSSGPAVQLSLDPDRRGIWIEREGKRSWEPVDVVFPVLHGPFGEDGTIQGVFEIAGLPFVGSGVFSSSACMDKGHTKTLLANRGIAAGDWHSFPAAEWPQEHHADVVAGLGWPLFVKPVRAGSSMGVSKAATTDELHQAIASAAEHDPHVIVESSVENAREIECGVLVGPDGVARASQCAEIVVRTGHEFYDFEAKYLDDSVDLIVPAGLNEDVSNAVRELAIRAFRALECEGLARVDFFVEADGRILVNEINTMPGFTSISMYPRMWAATGVGYPELIDTLVSEALARSEGLR